MTPLAAYKVFAWIAGGPIDPFAGCEFPDCDCWRGDRGRCAVYDATLAGCAASGSATADEAVTARHAAFTTGGAASW